MYVDFIEYTYPGGNGSSAVALFASSALLGLLSLEFVLSVDLECEFSLVLVQGTDDAAERLDPACLLVFGLLLIPFAVLEFVLALVLGLLVIAVLVTAFEHVALQLATPFETLSLLLEM